ncbi:hypothetical protein K7X08_034601 [Anisodus acutangulus]|uniref:Mitochondrial glycoprotein n=1 Tax=Anisodus acutangulus TaxID=402998 RepID=A0A9Q1LH95_9SOLA|nr:hypothetical protein K7X08_034601 [Anisodus acutangulus]
MAMARRLVRPLGGIAKRVLLQQQPQPVIFNLIRNYISEMRREAFEENILRLLRYEIRYELERSPPSQGSAPYQAVLNEEGRESNDVLEFVCSAWPDSVEIRKVYMRGQKGIVDQPYVGPAFKELDDELQNSLYDFLETRGINDGLCVFLHQCMKNKDKLEFIRWMEKAKSFIERK